ncbi:MAG: maleylacetate reductase [Gemmatirosa sp.]|nr:maleylacetate reductase [Gemmatirosa sp.]
MSAAPAGGVAGELLGAGFDAPPLPARVLFGTGALDRLPELVDALGARRVLVVASAGRGSLIERVVALLGDRLADVDTSAVMHVPARVASAAHARAESSGADLVVALGGGSAIGLAKAIALAGGPPIVAVPTTYSGSEMTAIWGLTRDGAKETGRDERVRPRAVLYDPALTLSLPPRASGPSALNAVAHAVEALYAPDASPLVALAATEALRALASSVSRVIRAPDDVAARAEALYGAWLAGLALGASTMGLHHRLCHVLGGTFGLPHAETHAVLLPHTAAYNAAAAPAAMATAGLALGTPDVPAALHALLADVAGTTGAPASLRALGMSAPDLDRAAAIAAARPYPNPRPVTVDGVRDVLQRAWDD